MVNTNIEVLISESFEFVFIQAFVVEGFAASNAGITLEFCWFWVNSVTWVAVMGRTSELLGNTSFVFYNLSSMVWKFSQKGLRKEARKMVKLIAFTRKRTLKHRVLVLHTLSALFFCFGMFFRFAILNLFLMIITLFQANRALKLINLLLTIKALWVMLLTILPFFELHCYFI